jgi:F-box-like
MGSIETETVLCAKRPRLHSPLPVHDDNDDSHEDHEYIPPHPLGVRPDGNAIFNTSSDGDLRPHLGLFASLSDELLAYFLEYLSLPEVVSLGATCKAFYAFTRVDELWRKFFEE